MLNATCFMLEIRTFRAGIGAGSTAFSIIYVGYNQNNKIHVTLNIIYVVFNIIHVPWGTPLRNSSARKDAQITTFCHRDGVLDTGTVHPSAIRKVS